jgi:imidazolonepropionase
VTIVAHISRRLVTCDPAREGGGGLAVLEDGAIVVGDEAITWVGPKGELPAGTTIVDHGERVLTPGLVDAHTHACWAGSRHGEYAVRMAGGDYEAIAKAGGGILSTQRAVAEATTATLTSLLAGRLRRMASLGVTTVEVKSGYGLEAEQELRQLEVIATLGADPGLPRIVPTYLALHALPLSARAARAAFVSQVARETVPEVARRGLARFVDAYIDREAFQLEEARLVFNAASAAGLGIRAHVGQFADIGGAELSAEHHAASVDHLEHIGDAGLLAIARSGTHPVLLPVASFTLSQPPPPIAKMRERGLEMVVASDANPGTAPTESLPLALAFAVRSYGLTPVEALLGATRHAGASLRVPCGALAPGRKADFVVWDFPHETCLVQPWGVPRAVLVVRDGAVIFEAPATSASP